MCIRCPWAGDDPLYIAYHDNEWGVPIHDDFKHFEFITLEGAQAGLSWITVLKKRDNYRVAFDNFDFEKVSLYDNDKVEQLMQNAGIVRNRLKITSTIDNAKAFIKLREEFGTFDKYIWSFTDNKTIVNSLETIKDLKPATELSIKISKDLKKRGFRFVGETIIYAYMQAVGIVDDHINTCFKKKKNTLAH